VATWFWGHFGGAVEAADIPRFGFDRPPPKTPFHRAGVYRLLGWGTGWPMREETGEWLAPMTE